VKIVTGILVALMIATTFLTSRQMILKTGWNADPQQRMIQKLMLYGIPFMLLFSGGIFPSGVILYWVVNNSFSLGQQIWVLRKYPPPKANTDATGGITAKRGTKKYDEQMREKQERAKASAPKVGAKPAKAKQEGASKAAQELKRKQEQAKAKASQAPKPGAKPSNRKKGGATRGANK
ncbi:MAG TPA: YidC/Oxa1 family membrane protein insertase, partial [Stackebrandtia sp.]|uniref:YidC/Oxa1 family membrane protein insertase n=1 Tax=Stackebrandtia sp. TaxID=2023065 RepID=UPI002D6521B4